MNNFSSSLLDIDRTLTVTTTPDQCGPGSNSNEGVFHTHHLMQSYTPKTSLPGLRTSHPLKRIQLT